MCRRIVVLLVLVVSWLVPAVSVQASRAVNAGQGCGDNTMPMYDCRMQEVPITAWSLTGPYTLDQYDGGNACPVGESCPSTAAQCIYYPVAGAGDEGWSTRCASGATASQTMTTGDNADGAYGAYCLFLGRSDQSARTMVVSIIPLDDQSTGNYEWIPREPNAEVCTANRLWSSGVGVRLTINVSNDGVGAAPVRFNIDSMILVFAVPPATGTATASGTATGTPDATPTGVPTRNCGVVDDCDMVYGEAGAWHPVSGYGPGSCAAHDSAPFTVHCDGPDAFWQNFVAPLTGQICTSGEGTAGVSIDVQFFTGSTSNGRTGTQVGADFSIGGLSNPPQCTDGFVAGSSYYMEISPRNGGPGATNIWLISVVASVDGTATPTATITATLGSATATGTATVSPTPHQAGTAVPTFTGTLIPRPTSTFTGTTTVDCGLLCDCMIVAAQIIAGGERAVADAQEGVVNAENGMVIQQQRLANAAGTWSGALTASAGTVASGESAAANIGGTYVYSSAQVLASPVAALGGSLSGGFASLGYSVITGTNTLAGATTGGFNALNTGVTQAGGIVGASVLTGTSQVSTALDNLSLSGSAAISSTGLVLSAAADRASSLVAASVITATQPLGVIGADFDGITVAVAGLVTATTGLASRIDDAGPWMDHHLIGDSTTGINGLGNSTHDIADQIQSAFMVGDCSSLLPTCVSEFSAFNTELAAGGTVALTEVGAGESAIGAELAVIDGAVVAGNTEAVAAAGVFGVDFAAIAGGIAKLAGVVPCGTTVGGVSVDSPLCGTGDAINQVRQDVESGSMPNAFGTAVVGQILPTDPSGDIAPLSTAVAGDVPNFHSIDASVPDGGCLQKDIYGGHIDLCNTAFENQWRLPLYNFLLVLIGLGALFKVVQRFQRMTAKGRVG